MGRRGSTAAVFVLVAVLVQMVGCAPAGPPPVGLPPPPPPPVPTTPPPDYVRLDGTVTIGEATFRPDDLRGTISWETKRSPSGITTLLRSPDLVGQVAMQNVTQAEVNAHRTTADLLEFLAPRVLATDVDVTPVDTYEIVDPGDGSVRAVPVGALVGPDDCIAAASYAVNGVEGIISVVVPGCGGSGGVELDSYVDAGTDQRRYVAYLPALIVPAIVGRTG